MKRKPVIYSAPEAETPQSVVQEIAVMPGVGETISVRAAKAHLSGLLDWVAQGREVVVTSGGTPKARITPIVDPKRRKVFQGSRAHLAKMPPWTGGPTAEEIVRDDRDARGW